MKRVVLLACLCVGCGDDGGSAPEIDAAAPVDAPGPDAPPVDTWASYAEAWFVTYCTSCHEPGGSGYRIGQLDFHMYDRVVANAAGIRCGVSPVAESGCGAFPPPAQFPIGDGPFPTDEERNRLVDWIEAGTPP